MKEKWAEKLQLKTGEQARHWRLRVRKSRYFAWSPKSINLSLRATRRTSERPPISIV